MMAKNSLLLGGMALIYRVVYAPPLRWMVWPVICRASGPARKNARPATSSGVTARFVWVTAIRASRRSPNLSATSSWACSTTRPARRKSYAFREVTYYKPTKRHALIDVESLNKLFHPY
ncbi:hypothetical protein BISU_3006 [Bifidobacterium subtile]|uniref:Uncharacterized protein n=1 Tax=Bifidobacterium subtile TaxID=77635 RepID=A0A087E5P4_9BIFI|nr:hypothetical protein BISU_3006 [Bifidobacterium subtile]